MGKVSSIFNSNNFPISLVYLLIVFTILEIITRIVFVPQNIPEEIYTKYSPKYDYGFDEEEALFYQQGKKYVLYPTPYLDFWKKEISASKPDNQFRIFTIGSSVSRADFHGSYSYFLEKYLNSTAHNANFEVINCSATGIGSSRILSLFQKSLTYDPDFVIIHLHGSNEFEDERDLKEAQKLGDSYEGIIRKSWFFCVLKKFVDENVFRKMQLVEDEIDPETYARWFIPGKRDEWFNTLSSNTTQIVKLAGENSIPILFVNRVFNSDTLATFEDEESVKFNSITKQIDQKNVFMLDTPELFLSRYGKQTERDSIFIDTVHWTPETHEFIAKQIAQILENNNLLPLRTAHKVTKSSFSLSE